MISIQEPQVIVTRTATGSDTYYTLSENNFGSLHHATFCKDDLRKLFDRLDKGEDDYPEFMETMQLKHGHIWNNHPFRGFAKIWEVSAVSDKHRSVSLTFGQIGGLLVRLSDILT